MMFKEIMMGAVQGAEMWNGRVEKSDTMTILK